MTVQKTQRLTEVRLGALGRVVESVESDGSAIWEATLVTEGTGSSGDYTPELLAASTRAFVAAEDSADGIATKNFFKHLSWHDDEHDPRDQWGYLVESAWHEPGVGLKAKIKVLPHWRDVVESLAAEGQAQLSIYAAAAINEETGEIVAILPHITNSIDLVSHPGRPGSELARKIESARESYKPGVTSASAEKGNTMNPEEVKAAIAEAVAAARVAFVNESTAAKASEAQAKVDAEALESAGTTAVAAYKVKAEAIEAAELLPAQATELRERAERGEDITKAIESAKVIKTEAVKAAAEAAAKGAGIGNGAGADDDDWGVSL